MMLINPRYILDIIVYSTSKFITPYIIYLICHYLYNYSSKFILRKLLILITSDASCY